MAAKRSQRVVHILLELIVDRDICEICEDRNVPCVHHTLADQEEAHQPFGRQRLDQIEIGLLQWRKVAWQRDVQTGRN